MEEGGAGADEEADVDRAETEGARGGDGSIACFKEERRRWSSNHRESTPLEFVAQVLATLGVVVAGGCSKVHAKLLACSLHQTLLVLKILAGQHTRAP